MSTEEIRLACLGHALEISGYENKPDEILDIAGKLANFVLGRDDPASSRNGQD